MKTPGLSKKRHEEIAQDLRAIRERLMEIDMEVSKAYGKTRRPYHKRLANAIQAITFVRAFMGVKAGKEHDDMEWGVKTYGGAGSHGSLAGRLPSEHL